MRVHILAIGRLGPRSEERGLTDDYMARYRQTARGLGWGALAEKEMEDRKGGGMAAEAALLRKAIPAGALRVCLDERGLEMTSPAFAQKLSAWADQGRPDIAFVIGGADGLEPGLRAEADMLLSFGKMVWPHKLVRVMLAEQLYRATSILAGAPYHRV